MKSTSILAHYRRHKAVTNAKWDNCVPGEKMLRKLFKKPGDFGVVDNGGVIVVVVLGRYLTVFVLFGAGVAVCGRTNVCPISGFAWIDMCCVAGNSKGAVCR